MSSRINRRTLYSHRANSGNPYWPNVKALCHFDTSSGNPAVYVNTAVPVSPAVTIANNSGIVPNVSATQSKYGGFSLGYAGAANSFVKINGGAAFTAVGTGDATAEFYCRLGSVSGTYLLLDSRPAGGSSTNAYAIYTTGVAGVIEFYQGAASRITSAGGTLVVNTWHHIAWSRVAGTSRLFVDGNKVGSDWTDATDYSGTGLLSFGAAYNGASVAVSSFFDDFRYTVGVGRYTENFTPPSTVFPDN